MAESEGTRKPEIKVNDRRRVDMDGKDREDSPPAMQNDTAATAVASGSSPSSENKGVAPENEREAISFSSFLISMATQALMQLGELPPPEGVKIKPDKRAAQEIIDLLAVLERKTAGNLDSDEQRLITEVLHNLRVCFVRKG